MLVRHDVCEVLMNYNNPRLRAADDDAIYCWTCRRLDHASSFALSPAESRDDQWRHAIGY